MEETEIVIKGTRAVTEPSTSSSVPKMSIFSSDPLRPGVFQHVGAVR
jgi:hypothetical protein